MGKIRNIFIKQHQQGRWRYLSLLAQSVDARFPAPLIAHASQRVPNTNKTPEKLTALYLLLGYTLGNTRRHINLVDNSLPYFLISNAHIVKSIF